MNHGYDRAYAEISLDYLQHNYKEICSFAKNSTVMSIVKCNAYGHGATIIARELQELGSKYLAVATIEEAAELRENGITAPLIILSPVRPSYSDYVVKENITLAVFGYEQAGLFSDEAIRLQKPIKIHIKLDTGMSRFGILTKNRISESVEEIGKIASLPGLILEGIFSHMPSGDSMESDTFNRAEIKEFQEVCDHAEERGIKVRYRHLASSASLISYPESHFNMVRPGLLTYGYFSDKNRTGGLLLKPVMHLKTRIMQIKTLPAGSGVSYNRTFISDRETAVAVVGIGYGDGVMRAASNRSHMLVKGKPAKILGRICMDAIIIDISGIEGVQVGDIVTVFGEDNGAFMPLYDYLDAANAISHEFISGISPRVPRIFYKNGKQVARQDYVWKTTI